MKFTVEIDTEDRHWIKVQCGDRYEDHLGKDEALYTVACLIIGADPPKWLRTAEEHKAHEAAMRAPISGDPLGF